MKMKSNKTKSKFLLWLSLLFILNFLLINLAITENYQGNIPKTTISYTIFQGTLLSRITLLISELLNSLIYIRVFLTALSMIGLFSIVRLVQFLVGKKAGILAGLLYLLSPPHLYFLSTINPLAILISIILIGVLFFLTTPLFGKLAGALLLVISAFLSPSALLITGIIFIFNIINKERFRKTKIFLGIVFAFLVIAWYLFGGFEFTFPAYIPSNLMEITFEFGNIFGIYIITLIYGLIGLFIGTIKKHKKALVLLLLGSTIMLFQSLYYLAFSNIIFCLFAGTALKDSLFKKWNIQNAKIATGCAIFAVLILSVFSFFSVLPQITLNDNLIEEADNIITTYPLNNISTHPYYSSLLNYVYMKEKNITKPESGLAISSEFSNLGQRKNLKELLSFWNQTQQYNNQTISNIHKLYYSREIDETLNAAKELGIKYIIVTNEMKEGLVWKFDEEGLLFLLRNKEVFKVKKINDEVNLIEINAPGNA